MMNSAQLPEDDEPSEVASMMVLARPPGMPLSCHSYWPRRMGMAVAMVLVTSHHYRQLISVPGGLGVDGSHLMQPLP